MGHGGEEALALGLEDLLAGKAVVATGQRAELYRPLPCPIAIALLRLHRRRLSGLGQASAGWGASARAMRLASAWPR